MTLAARDSFKPHNNKKQTQIYRERQTELFTKFNFSGESRHLISVIRNSPEHCQVPALRREHLMQRGLKTRKGSLAHRLLSRGQAAPQALCLVLSTARAQPQHCSHQGCCSAGSPPALRHRNEALLQPCREKERTSSNWQPVPRQEGRGEPPKRGELQRCGMEIEKSKPGPAETLH